MELTNISLLNITDNFQSLPQFIIDLGGKPHGSTVVDSKHIFWGHPMGSSSDNFLCTKAKNLVCLIPESNYEVVRY